MINNIGTIERKPKVAWDDRKLYNVAANNSETHASFIIDKQSISQKKYMNKIYS